MSKITITVTEEPEDLETELVERLREGVVTFYYKKSSTSQLRVAHGTLNPKYFHYKFRGGRHTHVGQINYWDLDRRAWRSVLAWNIIKLAIPDGHKGRTLQVVDAKHTIQ